MGNFQSNSKNRFIKSSTGKFKGRGKFKHKNPRKPEKRITKMHEVTCDKCKKQCKVPFKPTGDKPVYCSDCFRKNDNSNSSYGSRSQDTSFRSSISSEEFELINEKLDKIIQALEIDSDEDEE